MRQASGSPRWPWRISSPRDRCCATARRSVLLEAPAHFSGQRLSDDLVAGSLGVTIAVRRIELDPLFDVRLERRDQIDVSYLLIGQKLNQLIFRLRLGVAKLGIRTWNLHPGLPEMPAISSFLGRN